MYNWWYKYYLNIKIISIWPTISKMTTKDYPDISSFAFGNGSRQSSDDFGKTDMCLAFEMQIWCYKHWLKCSDVFNTAAIFQCGLHRLTELLRFALKYLYAVENVFVNKLYVLSMKNIWWWGRTSSIVLGGQLLISGRSLLNGRRVSSCPFTRARASSLSEKFIEASNC